ncbi:hypothetical protein SAMN05892883_2885 [Jatrophihabitans sp. GAS493]|uniref:DUF5825 family protein n=1 Tax=Jatrophihabitans sp. GAS493 TaxID=1907575 RepID=UPI000BB93F03|nr:DUF5825 family protein [Jatrophihabitans sp. GAS493]SOD73601.1 hypothetical protein SAMN05892883_2885 [Jatrophihabitans sp. GAS493]
MSTELRSKPRFGPADAGLQLHQWRHHDLETTSMPAVSAGSDSIPAGADPAATAARLFADGVRRVEFGEPVELSGRVDPRLLVTTMLLLGELTALGVVVDWDVDLGELPDVWTSISHLSPPRRIVGLTDEEAQGILDPWRSTFYLDKCVYRQGPGFIQVRDRRDATLHRLTIDDPLYLDAVAKLSRGCAIEEVPTEVWEALLGEQLVGVVGGLAWWMPYRVRRWPWPSFAV